MNFSKLFALFCIFSCLSCGPMWEDGIPYQDGISSAIPDGVYFVSVIPDGESIPARVVCANNSRPSLKVGATTNENLRQLIAFGEFTVTYYMVTILDGTITKTWIRDSELTDVFPNANTIYPNGVENCSVTSVGSIVQNSNNIFQESGSYIVAWQPSNCKLEVHNYSTVGGPPIGGGAWVPATTLTFESSTSTTNQNQWEVSSNGNTYTLTMPEELAQTQTAYDCTGGSKIIKMIWTKVESE